MPKLINGLPPKHITAGAADAGESAFWSTVYDFMKKNGYAYKYGDIALADAVKLEKALLAAVNAFVTQNADSLQESTEEKKKFFDYVDKNYEGTNESVKPTQHAVKSFKDFLTEAGGETGWTVLVHKTPLAKARPLSEKILAKYHRDLNTELPNFDANYEFLRGALKKSWGVQRRDMPVINADQIDQFARDLRAGALDILKPFAKGKALTAADVMKLSDPEEYITLGLKDENHKDDVLVAKMKMVPCSMLKPIQEEIYLDKVDNMIGKFGAVKNGNPVTKLTMIVSKDGYIIDGHHRYATVLLCDPSVKVQILEVPMKIDDLLKVTLAYGDAIGNKRNV